MTVFAPLTSQVAPPHQPSLIGEGRRGDVGLFYLPQCLANILTHGNEMELQSSH